MIIELITYRFVSEFAMLEVRTVTDLKIQFQQFLNCFSLCTVFFFFISLFRFRFVKKYKAKVHKCA